MTNLAKAGAALGGLFCVLAAMLVDACRRAPKGCEECGGYVSCLHCPAQGSARCPIARRSP